MAWLYRQKGSSKWWIGWRANGRQFLKSTKTEVRAEAEKQLARTEALFAAHRAGSVVDEVYQSLTSKVVPKVALKAALNDWIDECRGATSPSTVQKYEAVRDELCEYLHATDKAPVLADIQPDALRGYLTRKRSQTTASTVNVLRKILSGFFIRAIKNGQTQINPMLPVKAFKAGRDEEQARRAFTLHEVKDILDKCPNDFWRFMAVSGFYTGQRLGDLITLTWANVDFEQNVLAFTTAKTRRRMKLPMAGPLRAQLSQRRNECPNAKPSDYVWPEQAALYIRSRSGTFSNEFHEILAACGLVVKRPAKHKAAKGGRSSRRMAQEVSFHCFRHTFVSMLKLAGTPQAAAMELAGHESAAVSTNYTHVGDDALTKAINKLPQI